MSTEKKELCDKIINRIDNLLLSGNKTDVKKLLRTAEGIREYSEELNRLCICGRIDDIEQSIDREYTWREEYDFQGIMHKYEVIKNMLSSIGNGNPEEQIKNVRSCIELINSLDTTIEGVEYFASAVCEDPELTVERIWDELVLQYNMDSMTELPLVSVVVATYNHENDIEEVIDSVVGQTYPNFELIITDDGSKDGTADVIRKKMEQLQDDRIVFYPHENNTCFANIEEAYHSAKGKYITDLGGDDLMHCDKLLRQVAFLEKNREIYKACFTWAECDGNNSELNNNFMRLFNRLEESSEKLLENIILRGNRLCAPSFMMDREIYEELGTQNYTYRQLQDYELWIKYLNKYKLFIIPQRLTIYRVSEGSVSFTRDPKWHILSHVENESIIFESMERMTKDVFIKTFRDIYPKIENEDNTEADIKCLKIKMLLKVGESSLPHGAAAIRLYYRWRDDKEFMDMMKNKYGMDRPYMYTMAAEMSGHGQAFLYRMECDRLKGLLESKDNNS